MFLQIHNLTSFAAALLNRDDAGLAKRIPFGNADRMRVSSQCLKKHWRDELHRRLDLPRGIRSRMFFEREILRRVMDAGLDEAIATKLIKTMIKELISSKDKDKETTQGQAKKKKKKTEHPLHLRQPILMGKPEADYFVRMILECSREGGQAEASLKSQLDSLEKSLKARKNNWPALLKAAGMDDLTTGIEGALFGRFVTSDILARSDAAVHVAHAFTVHELMTEVDYFTVVDDLKEDLEHAGAAHAGDMELGAGLFYGYVVVDLPLLVSNLCGCDPKDWAGQPPETIKDTRDVLTRLIQAIATVSPGAKLGATAPYARAACMLLETGASQPRTLANAYLTALKPEDDPLQQAVDAMGRHLSALDEMYGCPEKRFISSIQATDAFADTPRASLAESTAAALSAVFGGP